jgi:hypothetical protein
MFFFQKANLFKYMLPQSKGNLFFHQADKKAIQTDGFFSFFCF